MSETPQTAAATIQAVMKDAQALGKGEFASTGKGQQGYNFRGIDAVMNLIGPLLRKHGAFIVPEVVQQKHETTEQITRFQNGGEKTQYVTRTVVTVAYHWHGPDGSTVSATVAGEAFDYGDKATSKAMSVAMRTYLLQTLCLPTNEPDPDLYQYGQDDALPQQSAPAPAPRAAQAAPSAPRLPATANECRDHLFSLSQQRGINPADIAARVVAITGGTPIEDVTDAAVLQQVIAEMEGSVSNAQ
jgi:hypothetical protein